MVGKTYLRYIVGPQGGSVVSRAALTMDAATAQETYINTEEKSSHHHNNNNNYDSNSGNYKSNMKRERNQSRQMHLSPTLSVPAVLFVPALEAVHVYAVRTGKLLHTLIPSGLTMPVEVTSLRVYSRMHEELSNHVIVSSSGAGINEIEKVDNGNNNSNKNNNQELERNVKRKSIKSNKADQNVVTYTEKSKVSNSFTSIARHGWMLLVGYSNGYVALFDCGPHNNYGKPICVFYALGHKIDTNVLSLCCNVERMYGCSGGQDTDLTIWDLTALEPVFRLRGHRGAIVGIDFINRYHSSFTTLKDITHNNNYGSSREYSNTNSRSNNNDLSATAGMYNTQYVVSSSADGLLKIWDITLRQCVQSILVADTPLTAMMVDECGRRVYCGMREGFIKVYSTDHVKTGQLAITGSLANNNNNSSAEELPHTNGAQDVNILHDHGNIARKHHKPITSFHFSSDDRLLLACTSKTVEVYKVLSANDVRRKVQRKRQRQRQAQHKKVDNDVHKSQQNEELEFEELSEENVVSYKNVDSHTETEGSSIANALYDATAAEEVILLRTFFMSDKVRSACFVPSDELINLGSDRKSQRGNNNITDAAIHIAVTFANNSILTYTTSLTSRDNDGSAMATLTDLRVKFTFTERAHHSDIKHLCFVNNDSALLSMSAERVLLWAVKVEEDLLDVDHLDRSDFYDAQEANLKRTTFKGSLNCVGSVAVTEATAMTAISSSLCCVGQANGSILLIDVASSEVLCEEPNVHVGEVKDVRTRSDRSGFLSLGADRRLVLWTVGLLENNNHTKNGNKATKHKVTDARSDFNGNANSEEEEEWESEEEESSSSEKVVGNKRKGDKQRKKHSYKKLRKEKEENEEENENDTVSEIPHTRHSQATLIQVQEIELAETPLFAQFSNEDKFLAVGLQNNNIQLFFADSFKPYLALFGHKLPPTCVAFTSDNTLVASTGMDKSLRFWGTDFGDCHRAIHAHDDYVTAVVFQPETHYAFTASLDGSVKMWDGDNWTMVQLFRQHQRGLWSVCVTYNGTCLASAGVDRTIRCFLRTQDIVFPEEEEEKMAQEAMDEENAIRLAQQRLDSNTIEQEVGIVGHPTASTAEAAEQLMEALDLVSVEQQRKHNPEDKAKHPLLVNCTE